LFSGFKSDVKTAMVRTHLSRQLAVTDHLLVERLHGELAQLLAMALIHLHEAQSGQQPQALGRAQRLVLQAMQATRSLLHDLYPTQAAAPTPNTDLAQRLQQCVQGLQLTHGTSMAFVCDGHVGVMSGGVSDTLLNGARELLVNALKHGQVGGHIETRLTARHNQLVITISDRGPGHAPDWAPPSACISSGLGLPLLRARLAHIGATLRWRSAGQQGVQARIRWAHPAGLAPEAVP
jgi:signal transduction histidine kinase